MQRVTKIWIAVVVIAGAATTGGIVGWQQWQVHQAQELVETMRKGLEDRVREGLKDPDSAKFTGEFLSRSDNPASPVISLCGQVNAKNSYGGYGGFSAFIVNSDMQVVFYDKQQASSFAPVWDTWCRHPL